ncbi:MAG: DUF4830 domain-containing protein [Clostridia bacterium]|nr:DUF4830 domain-containing protein [Clostridia bacterium]
MVLSVGANKKRIAAVLVLVALAVGAFLLIPTEPETPVYPAMTNEERLAFLSSFGWTLEEEPADVREVVIPAEFSDVYTAYNAMQIAQGFDLQPYAGEKCTQYRYIITNYPDCTETVIATLLVCEDRIIGGDIAVETADGFMHGFAPNSAHFEAPAAAE